MEDLIYYTIDMNYSTDNQNCTIIAKVINATKEILYTGIIEVRGEWDYSEQRKQRRMSVIQHILAVCSRLGRIWICGYLG